VNAALRVTRGKSTGIALVAPIVAALVGLGALAAGGNADRAGHAEVRATADQPVQTLVKTGIWD
jgi:hypothetical protein